MKSSMYFKIIICLLFSSIGFVSLAVAEDSDSSDGTSARREWPSNNIGIGAACLNEMAKASSACDFTRNSQLSSSTALIQSSISQIQDLLNKKAAQEIMNGQCTRTAQLASSVSLALGAFTTYCTTEYLQCQTACDQAQKEMAAHATEANLDGVNIPERQALITDAVKACAGLRKNTDAAKNQFSQYIALGSKMDECKKMTANDLQAKCAANPNDPMCSGLNGGNVSDCSSAAGKSNQVCICQANPGAPGCIGSAASNSVGKNSYADPGDSISADGLGNFGADALGGAGNDSLMGSVSPTGGAAGGRGFAGAAGGGAHGGGGSGSAAGNSKSPMGKSQGGAAGTGLNTKILAGFNSVSGGPMGARGGGGEYNNPAYAKQAGATGNNPNNVDLKKFLPGGQMDPARGLAGISGPDGMTGPNTDNWQKVNIRYQEFASHSLP